jgi:hypothetical protein
VVPAVYLLFAADHHAARPAVSPAAPVLAE